MPSTRPSSASSASIATPRSRSRGLIVTRLASRLVDPWAWWCAAAAAAASSRRSVKAVPPPPWQWRSTYAGTIVPLTRSAARGPGAGLDGLDRRDALAVDLDEHVGQHGVVDEGWSAQCGVHRGRLCRRPPFQVVVGAVSVAGAPRPAPG